MKAQQQGGNVIKIIGNHEDINIHNIYNTRYISRYISRYAIMNNFYRIKREERIVFFMIVTYNHNQ